MSKKRRRPSPSLSPAQQESPQTLEDAEIERRRAHLAAREAAERQRHLQNLVSEGTRLLVAQRPAEALAPLRQAHEWAPDDPDIAVNLGGALVAASKWSKAVQFLEEAVNRHPDNARLWLNLAAAYLGRLPFSSHQAQERAIAAFERAIEIDPAIPNAHYSIGLIYAERQDWQQARAWFQQALETHPQDQDAATWLGRVEAVLQEEP